MRPRGSSRPSGAVRCPGCGGEAHYSEVEDDYYRWECEEYVGGKEIFVKTAIRNPDLI